MFHFKPKINASCGLALILLFVVPSTWAAVQTTPFLAIRSVAKYTHLNVMPYANAQAPKGGYLTQAVEGTFDNLNAMNGKGTAAEGTVYLFDTLMSRSLDEPNVMYPLLAQQVTYDLEKMDSVIFHLNPQAKFSDGSRLTAHDVKFSFDTFRLKSNLGLQMYLADVKETQVLSPEKIKITFKSKHNLEMPLILAQLPIYSKQDWQKKDFSRLYLQPILGSGPYLLDQIQAGRSISYRRNPNYWAKNLPVNRGRYNFDRLKYVYYRNSDIAFEAFKAGEYTLHHETTVKNWVTQYQFPAVKQGLIKQYVYQHQLPIPTQSFVLNTRRNDFKDIYFRQALTLIYDFEWQNKALFYGQYQRLQSFFSNSELEAKGLPSKAELDILTPYLKKLHPVQKQGVLKNWRYPVSDGTGFNRSGLLTARQILLNAGYFYQKGQLFNPQKKPVQFEFLVYQDDVQRTLLPFVRNLRKLGMKVNIRKVDLPQYMERKRKYDFDIILEVMPQSLTPGNEQKQLWSSAAANQPNNYNYSGIQNVAVDAMIQGIIQAQNRTQLVTYTQSLDRLLRAGYYQIPTYGKAQQWYAYWNMYQQPKIQPKLSVGLDYWWSDPQKAQKINQYLKK